MPTGDLDPYDAESTDFEVVTTTSDAARADVRVVGELSARSVPLLLGVLHAHLRAGRTQLRLDLAGATGSCPALQETIRRAVSLVTERGGTVVVGDAAAHDPFAGVPA
jgi:hypothetical protein